MSARLVIVWAATAAVSAGAGWLARGPAAAAAPVAPSLATVVAPARAVTAAVPPGGERPLIAVSSDGQVTLRVEQQPLDWVLEQIALQSGRTDVMPARVHMASTAAAADAEAAEPQVCPPPYTPADPARLLLTIEHGAEAERVDALLRARSDGWPVPEALLRTLLETAGSERVRVAALESWLDLHSDDPKAQHAALETALLLPSPAVQAEARQRLDDLLEIERLDALAAQGNP